MYTTIGLCSYVCLRNMEEHLLDIRATYSDDVISKPAIFVFDGCSNCPSQKDYVHNECSEGVGTKKVVLLEEDCSLPKTAVL